MRKILSIVAICALSASAFAATPAPDRRSMAQQWGTATRATASRNQLSAMSGITTDKSSTQPIIADAMIPADRREKEKAACINNNIGAGNTFVWASRYSNTSNYASMVEDIDNPENNVCFVRVELKSSDSKISVSDIQGVYYEMGRTITCGSWADEKKLESRILDAKKSARTWGTVAGVVGGAGVGVGAMELFGNKLIGGSVQGQKALNENELIRSQLLILKDKDIAQYNTFRNHLQRFKAECESSIWSEPGTTRPVECDSISYDALLTI